ncbi:LANO_0G00870g1_1 [Lachancea nothofagi CBS 11611]|uniref:LANO_0G00870g1_1 n=1 Tax=Lachancea nothofagi CBS 11611 TaxID=1266666 RepID=A0A1G4KEK4_9SACH|nr:LANO_0G00870g1_1 [Lachancea nothofagi CBS 11611]
MVQTPSTGTCLRVLNRFCKTNSNYELFYGSRILDSTQRVLVLDSSFNPPHCGHLNLVQRAVKHFGNCSLHVILLLSTNNADKLAQPASFDKRMDMMCIMADILEEDSIRASVGITKFGKFIDKSDAMHKELDPKIIITYLLGFDTVVRIFDSKYYKPLSTAEALKNFMEGTDFFCLTRKDEIDCTQQLNYVRGIASGDFEPDIPKSWHSKVVIEENDSHTSEISSSKLRKAIRNPKQDVSSFIPSEIYKYITEGHDNESIFDS